MNVGIIITIIGDIVVVAISFIAAAAEAGAAATAAPLSTTWEDARHVPRHALHE